MSSRPKREIPVMDNDFKWAAKWEQFAAEETKKKGDGISTCKADLYFRDDIIAPKKDRWMFYPGSTGTGHAEMNALHQFINDICSNNVDILELFVENKGLRIDCSAKPCCRRCSSVLGALKVIPWDNETTKTTKTMGSTQWGGLGPVQSGVVCQLLKITPQTFESL